MADAPSHRYSIHGRHPSIHWGVLLLATVAFVGVLEIANIPAALLLGAMAGAAFLSGLEGRIALPGPAYILAQGIIGCLIARSFHPQILPTLLKQWPIVLFSVMSVIVASTALGALLAKFRVLPGTTAVWGTAPGAATPMVLMADAFGGDVRLVAFMQYLRVIFVAIAASSVARLTMPPGTQFGHAIDWFPPTPLVPFLETLALAVGGAIAGRLLRIPAGGLLVPLALGLTLRGSGLLTITLPPWLLAISYAIIGWSIGRRFTLDIIRYAAKSFFKVSAAIIVLIIVCGGLAYIIHVVGGIDPLTAYFATSPGGADSIAIIASSSQVDLPFVITLQTARFLVVLFIGPAVARAVSRWAGRYDDVKPSGTLPVEDDGEDRPE